MLNSSKIKKNLSIWIALLLISFTLTACNKNTNGSDIVPVYPTISESAAAVPEISFDVEVKTGENYNDADTVITLADNNITINGTGATAADSVLTITRQGTYLISGELSDGQIIVNTNDSEKVKLVFNGIEIYCSDNAPVYVISAPKKVILYTVKNSVNIIKDNTSYNIDENDSDAPSAAIFSMEDIKIDGEGDMYITANYNKGIMSKDDIEIAGGNWYIKSVDDGIRGKDSVEMTGGYISIESGADGLRSSNDSDTAKGYISISGGELYIKSEQDGIQAETSVTVTGGMIVILSGFGSANSSTGSSSGNDWGQWGNPRNSGGASPSNTSNTASAKGIKGLISVMISGGSVSIDSSDDAIHSDSTVEISGADIVITSGDDGIHANDTLNISGGIINISKSYEGIEATTLNLSGGTIYITASDDGINAAGGSDGSSTGGRPGQGVFTDANGKINFTGSNIIINAVGDGIDSNGNIEMTNGVVIVFGPTSNNNAAIDFDGKFTISGGTIIGAGSSGMAQTPTGNGQKVIKISLKSSAPANSIICIKNSAGEEIAVFKIPKAIQSVVYSSPSLSSGTYTIYSGGSYSGDISQYGLLTGGTYSGGSLSGSGSVS